MPRFATTTAAAVLIACFAPVAPATEWEVSLWGERRAFTEHVEKLAELVAEKTDGEFTLNLSYGGLSENRENLDGIATGAFEMAQICAGYHPEKNRAITVLELPFLGVETLDQKVAVAHAVYQHPAVQEEMAQRNARILMTSPMPQYNLVGTGEPRETLEEMEGLRVRAPGGIGAAFEAVGAVPASMTATETYEAMKSGRVDAVSFAPHAHLSFGTIDEADWWTANLNPGTVNCPVVANLEALEALSDEHRAALEASIPEAIDHYLGNYAELLERWDRVLEEKGVQKVTISPEVLEAFRVAAAEPARNAWIETMSSQGLPANELYALVQSTLAEAKAGRGTSP
jgi:TRAP-type C4-dicarboxylate transport system substrate-binding protein